MGFWATSRDQPTCWFHESCDTSQSLACFRLRIWRNELMQRHLFLFGSFAAIFLGHVTQSPSAVNTYDVVIRNGTLYDGSGKTPVVGDLAINGDSIAGIGKLDQARGRTEIDAQGLAVAP